MGKTEETFGRNLRTYRAARRLSQSDLAFAMTEGGVRVHPSAISKIEAGNRAVRLDEAVAAASALGVPIGDLVSDLRLVTP